jgi:hypothetical protein
MEHLASRCSKGWALFSLLTSVGLGAMAAFMLLAATTALPAFSFFAVPFVVSAMFVGLVALVVLLSCGAKQ